MTPTITCTTCGETTAPWTLDGGAWPTLFTGETTTHLDPTATYCVTCITELLYMRGAAFTQWRTIPEHQCRTCGTTYNVTDFTNPRCPPCTPN